MAQFAGTVDTRMSTRSAVGEGSTLRVMLGNDAAVQRLLQRGGSGVGALQKVYLQLCYDATPPVRPDRQLVSGLANGSLLWNFRGVEKQESAVVSSLLMCKAAEEELSTVVLSAAETACSTLRHSLSLSSIRKRQGGKGGKRKDLFRHDKDPTGEVQVVTALCRLLARSQCLHTVELVALRKALGHNGRVFNRLGKGLKLNTSLKSFAISECNLSDTHDSGPLFAGLASHSSLVGLSLVKCGIRTPACAELVAMVIKSHCNTRDNATWSAGLRKAFNYEPSSVGAPPLITSMGILTLDLSGNKLGDAGMYKIAKALQSDTWVVGMNLSQNSLTDVGAGYLRVCLSHNTTLCALVLDDNPHMSPELEAKVEAELERRSLPEVILHEPPVVLMLSSWGYSANPLAPDGQQLSPFLPGPALPPAPPLMELSSPLAVVAGLSHQVEAEDKAGPKASEEHEQAEAAPQTRSPSSSPCQQAAAAGPALTVSAKQSGLEPKAKASRGKAKGKGEAKSKARAEAKTKTKTEAKTKGSRKKRDASQGVLPSGKLLVDEHTIAYLEAKVEALVTQVCQLEKALLEGGSRDTNEIVDEVARLLKEKWGEEKVDSSPNSGSKALEEPTS
ncbi:unnamed protein product [Chrysoparadoxa australica]